MDAIGDFLKKAKYREAYDTMCADVGDGDEIAPEGKPCIIKNYDELAFNSNKQPVVDSYEVGVEKLDQMTGVVSLLDKITVTDTYSKAFVNSTAYEIEQRINKAVETKDFSKLSDKEKTQAKYRIIRNVSSGKNKKLFLYK